MNTQMKITGKVGNFAQSPLRCGTGPLPQKQNKRQQNIQMTLRTFFQRRPYEIWPLFIVVGAGLAFGVWTGFKITGETADVLINKKTGNHPPFLTRGFYVKHSEEKH